MARDLISADSHVFEPLDLWEQRLPDAWQDRGPQRRVDGDRTIFEIDGRKVFSLRRAEDDQTSGHGGADPDQRLKDLRDDGVVGEVIYPTIGLFLYREEDPELAMACSQVYNDWAAEIFLDRSDVFCPVALVPVRDVAAAAAEVERVAELGFRAVSIPIQAPDDAPYNLDVYDPLWSAAAETGLPISIHVGTGGNPKSETGPGGAIINYLRVGIGAQDLTAYLAAGGVLQRHPDLRVVLAEAGAGWLGYACERMDEAFEEHAAWVSPKLEAAPSEFIRRQIAVSFSDERVTLLSRQVTGVEPLLWASDYPHPEGTWPQSQKIVAELFRDLPDDEADAIAGGNAKRIYFS